MTVNSIASSQMNTRELGVSMQRIASGLRINSAADDAAGLAISEGLTAQIRGFDQAVRNVQDMQSLVRTAEGGLTSIGDNLQRMRELTIQASNGILTDSDRQLIQLEIDQLTQEIDRTAENTEFNTMRLLDGSFSAEDGRGLHTSADPFARGPEITIGNMSSGMILTEPVDVTGGDIASGTGNVLEGMLSSIDNAMSRVSGVRSYLGAMENRFDTTIASHQTTNLNLSAGRSRIRDADIALEVMRAEQERILEQTQVEAHRRRQEQMGVQVLSMLG